MNTASTAHTGGNLEILDRADSQRTSGLSEPFAGTVMDMLSPLERSAALSQVSGVEKLIANVGAQDGFLGCEQLSAARLAQIRTKNYNEALVAEAFPAAKTLDVDKVLGIKGKFGLPACAVFSLDQPTCRIEMSSFYTHRVVTVNAEGASRLASTESGYKPFLPKLHSLVAGTDRIDPKMKEHINRSIYRANRGPLDESFGEWLQNNLTDVSIQVKFALRGLLASGGLAKPPFGYTDFRDKLMDGISSERIARLIESITLEHEFDAGLVPQSARESIKKAKELGIFQEIFLIAEASKWKISCTLSDTWIPEDVVAQRNWRSTLSGVHVLVENARDPLVIGYDGHKHYLLDRFDVTLLESWLASEFSEDLRTTAS